MRKSFGPQLIDQKISNLLKPLFVGNKKDFVIIGNLVKNWEEIIGKKYAAFCYPKAISFSKDKGTGGKLTIAVHNPAIGFFLENSSEIVIERIAVFYGYKAISKLIIKQEPKDVGVNKAKEIKLSQPKENFLQEKINKIKDEDLAETLRKLGREIFK